MRQVLAKRPASHRPYLYMLAQDILAAAVELGFDRAGIAPAEALPELEHFAPWIEQGRAASMEYLARKATHEEAARPTPYLREDIRHVLPWARSVVCCALNYDAPAPRSMEIPSANAAGRGWVSRYAWGSGDYHEILREKLERLAERVRELARDAQPELKTFVDTGPLLERVYARHAGLGWIGKNTCLIHPRGGSFCFLGALVLSLPLTPDSPLPDRCGTCRRCIEACPTGALDTPYQMDASLCLAYLNIENRGPIPEALREFMGRHIFGCDICQDVCPWNRKSPRTRMAEFQPRPELFLPDLETLAVWSEAQFRAFFRHSAMNRVKYAGWLRNIALAMGNSGQSRFIPTLERLAGYDDAMVREQAAWSLERLRQAAEIEKEVLPPCH